MAAEQEYPKIDGDVLYASEVNDFKRFGDGTDGAFSESSGTINLTQGTVYQYTSFLLDTSATLSASSTSQYPIIILVQGDVTINGTIDLSGNGATSSYHFAGGASIGTVGSSASGDTGGAGGVRGLPSWNFRGNQKGFIMNGTRGGNAGYSGGGGGASSTTNGISGSSGSSGTSSPGIGGNGGCSILIICGGNLTFGASSVIDVSGVDGTDGTASNDGGGGGGGAGDILIFYHGSKTDNGLSTDVTGGAGGSKVGAGGNGGNGAAGQVKIESFDTILW